MFSHIYNLLFIEKYSIFLGVTNWWSMGRFLYDASIDESFDKFYSCHILRCVLHFQGHATSNVIVVRFRLGRMWPSFARDPQFFGEFLL